MSKKSSKKNMENEAGEVGLALMEDMPEGMPNPNAVMMEHIFKSCQKLPASEYIVADISTETWREVVSTRTGSVYRIKQPVALIMRKGGRTHRVVDLQGIAHCYAAPEGGETVIRWANVEDVVKF